MNPQQPINLQETPNSSGGPINLQEPTATTQINPPIGVGAGQQLDPTIVNMARAIKQTETGSNPNAYSASGKSGEYGAYQFMPQTWNTLSQKYLGQDVPLTSSTTAQQNEVAYKYIQDLKNQGYNPAQVASIWNSGKPNPTGNVGVNKYGAAYNTPQYVKNVVNAYEAFKAGVQPPQTTTAPTTTPQPQKPSESFLPNVGQIGSNLSSQVGGLAKDVSKNIGDIANQLQGQKGSQGWWSDLLQTGGDIAGGIGDVINAGLQVIPGVQAGENWLGGQVGKLADTQVGQQVVKAIQGFQQAHPELSKDIGAVFNIATAIPMLKGIGLVKDAAFSGLGSALKGTASKVFTDGVVGDLGSTAKGAKIIANLGEDNVPTLIKSQIIDNQLIPDAAKGGVWDSTNAIKNSNNIISQIDNNELAPVLAQGKNDYISLDSIEKNALASAQSNLESPARVKSLFKAIRAKYGDYLNPQELNDAKRIISKKVPLKAFNMEGYNANLNVRQTLQKSIEQWGVEHNVPNINAINQKMVQQYNVQKILSYLHGRKIPVGKAGKLLRLGANTAVGAWTNGLSGNPILGLGSYSLAKVADKGVEQLPGILTRKILKNSGLRGVLPAALKGGAATAAGALPRAIAQKI